MDDTIENLCETWVKTLDKEYGLSVRHEDITEWDMRKSFPSLTEKEIYSPFNTGKLWKRVKPLPESVETLKALIEDGHKVFIVTASHPNTVKHKLTHVLFKYFPFFTYKDVIITSNKQMIKGDVLIDDAPFNLIGGDYKKILFSAPHNKEFDAQGNGLIRADNWKEVYTIIKELCEEDNNGS